MNYLQSYNSVPSVSIPTCGHRTGSFTKRLYDAHMSCGSKFQHLYSGDIAQKKATEYATLHAVLTEALDIYTENVVNRYSSALKPLYEAFSTIYPGKYSYHRFDHYMKEARDGGIYNIVLDHRHGNNRKINDVVKKWLLDAMSSGKAYGTPCIHEMITELCGKFGYRAPSLSWVKANYYKLLPTVAASRYGTDAQEYGQMPYAGILRASAPCGQWQIDGWRLPFYMEGYRTLTLFAVIDSCTNMIMGYYVDYSENTDTIMKGLEDAVRKAGRLPVEIVSDNHSFNKTKEAAGFKETLSEYGCTWTVTENPRHKAIVERGFGRFGDCFCKSRYGYVGEGVKTRRRGGRTSQELTDKYTKPGMWLTEDQIKLAAADMVKEWNTTADSSGEAPSARYARMDKMGPEVDEMGMMRLFIRRGEFTVRRGQIDIVRGGVKYEYQLNKDNYLKLNNKQVAVRYANYDMIYVFDIATDMYVCTVYRKKYAHGALADQTEEDRGILIRHKGRLNGIRTAFKNTQADIARRAESVDPDAAYAMNAKLTPKDTLEKYKTDGELRREAERLGVDIGTVAPIPAFTEVRTFGPDGERRKDARSPYTRAKHEVGITNEDND